MTVVLVALGAALASGVVVFLTFHAKFLAGPVDVVSVKVMSGDNLATAWTAQLHTTLIGDTSCARLGTESGELVIWPSGWSASADGRSILDDWGRVVARDGESVTFSFGGSWEGVRPVNAACDTIGGNVVIALTPVGIGGPPSGR